MAAYRHRTPLLDKKGNLPLDKIRRGKELGDRLKRPRLVESDLSALKPGTPIMITRETRHGNLYYVGRYEPTKKGLGVVHSSYHGSSRKEYFEDVMHVVGEKSTVVWTISINPRIDTITLIDFERD